MTQRIGDYRQDSGAGFRAWLWGITRNKLKELARRHANTPQAKGGTVGQHQLQAVIDLPEEESGDFQASEPRSRLMHRALEVIQVEFGGKLLHGDPEVVEKELAYLIEDSAGGRHLLKPAEFNEFVSSGKPFDQWR